MKKLIIIIAIIGCTLASAVAQGTIAFGNSVASRIYTCNDYPGSPARLAAALDGFTFGVFFGPAGSSEGALTQAPGTATIGATTPGVLTGAASVFALPGTEPGQVVSLQIRGWDSTGNVLGMTGVRQVTLGPTAGPGTVIWQGASGINPNRFDPLLVCIPEPSTIALGAMAGMFLLFRVRRTFTSNRLVKKLIIIIAIIGCSLASALAQGTIFFGNSVLSRVGIPTPEGSVRYLSPADGFTIGAFYGPAGSSKEQLVMAPTTAVIGAYPGIMDNVSSAFALPGTEPNQIVSLQIRAWNNLGMYGETKVAQVRLGPTQGPGTVIWQSEAGSNPNRFAPLRIIPEPSSIAIGLLGGMFLLFRLHHRARKPN